jgi:hypothetical protein
MVLAALLVAPTLMVVATTAERRFGAAAAGWIGAAPSTIALTVLVVGADLGPAAAAELAAGAAAHVGAQVAFAVAFSAVLRRRGGTLGLACATAAFAGASLLIAGLPAPAAMAAALPALAVGPRLLPAAERAVGEGERLGLGGTAIRAAVAALSVAGVLGVVRAAGPAAAGVIGGFPALSATLALLILARSGRRAAAHAIRGLVCGLPGYLAFCATVALLVPLVGVGAAVALALGACVVALRVTWRAVRHATPRRMAPSPPSAAPRIATSAAS